MVTGSLIGEGAIEGAMYSDRPNPRHSTARSLSRARVQGYKWWGFPPSARCTLDGLSGWNEDGEATAGLLAIMLNR